MTRDDDSNTEEKKISKKDFAKKMRHEAYQRAKEFKKTDPRELARKALAKEQRKALYQKAKERHKALKTAEKKDKPDLRYKVILASDLPADVPADERPLAPVIAIDFRKLKSKQPK